jgi:His-Xaa-Ser system radical SAM maturase HxsC
VRLHEQARVAGVDRTMIGRIARAPLAGAGLRADAWLLVQEGVLPCDPREYLGVLALGERPDVSVPTAYGLRQLDYLDDGDVVAVDPNGFVRTLYRRASPHNFILVTDQCNSYCLMCSQPPKKIDDFDRLEEHFRLIDLIDPATAELGITGGEPTLFRAGFLELIARCKERLPSTALHVLSNGRLFFYRRFAEQLGSIAHPDLVVGIPLYSDIDTQHDHIVQARGAFDETVFGLQHLGRYDVRIELRVVLHALSVPRLPQLATFIARNVPYACHVALMGLEMFGLVHQNLGELWIDPADYQDQLLRASEILCDAGMNVSIYNHQLCVLDSRLWPLATKSISDWKNIYLPACNGCGVMDACGGFFQSAAKIHSAHIRPLPVEIERLDADLARATAASRGATRVS